MPPSLPLLPWLFPSAKQHADNISCLTNENKQTPQISLDFISPFRGRMIPDFSSPVVSRTAQNRLSSPPPQRNSSHKCYQSRVHCSIQWPFIQLSCVIRDFYIVSVTPSFLKTILHLVAGPHFPSFLPPLCVSPLSFLFWSLCVV